MADTIWNNNYILSNMNAQKLYAQSPLTTGVSGTSAWIGIEPSAQYNETVLWEGEPTASNVGITLSEPMSGFEKVDIYWKSYERCYVDEVFATSNTSPIVLGAVFVLTDGNYEKSMTHWNTSNGTTYTWAATIHGLFTGTQSKSWNSNVVPLKIVGINRKENT